MDIYKELEMIKLLILVDFPYEMIADEKHEESEIVTWVEENIKGNYNIGLYANIFYFKDKIDATAFKLRWC